MFSLLDYLLVKIEKQLLSLAKSNWMKQTDKFKKLMIYYFIIFYNKENK